MFIYICMYIYIADNKIGLPLYFMLTSTPPNATGRHHRVSATALFLDDCTSRFTLILYIPKLSLVTIIMYYSKFIIAMCCHFKTFRFMHYLILNLSYERILLLIIPRVNIRLVEYYNIYVFKLL